jgi:hypothetical protein
MKNDKDWQDFLENIEDMLFEAKVKKTKQYVWVLDQGDGRAYRYDISSLKLDNGTERDITFKVRVFLATAGHKLDEIAFMITKEGSLEKGN